MIHQYKLGGKNIVIDVCSGSVHAVDDVAFDIISMFENTDKSTIIKSLTEKYSNTDGITESDILECY
jgi:uncharacterized protein